MIIVPVFLLGGAELALRIAGYGYRTSIFKPMQIGGKAFLVNNDDFSLRFFPPQVARFPGPIRMEPHKAPGTYRIFILGESAAMGDPDPSYGAGRYLDALLSARFPHTHFEIINLGITAINSNVILPIARECAAREGDLWIIYMGNNEMVGPFGAATVFGAQAPPLPLIRLNLAIQQARLGQLLTAFLRYLRKPGAGTMSWGGMEMFIGHELAPDDSRKSAVYRNFSKNLDDIVAAGLRGGAKILLNTVAVNLKDCDPFASLTDSNLPAADQARFNQLYVDGASSENSGKYAEAVQNFENAAELDAKVAELQFRLGKCLLALTNFAEAQSHFKMACDYDALPFRADSQINGIIRDEKERASNTNLIFSDTAAAIAASVRDGIPGAETFYEHVHFNFDGNYRLARVWAGKIIEILPSAILKKAGTNNWASQAACEQRLGLSDWNRGLVIESVIQRMEKPPLNHQVGNDERVQDLTRGIDLLANRLTPDAAKRSAANFERAVAQWPDDYYLHGNFALFLKSTGDVPGAVREWKRVCDLIPQDSFSCFQLARAMESEGDTADAESCLRQALRLRPGMTDAWVELGNVLTSEKESQSALEAYQRARQERPQDPQIYVLTGKALALLNRHAEAIESYREAIQFDPSDWEAHYNLAGELDASGQDAAALLEFGHAVELNPKYSRVHFNYGVVLARAGRFDEARREFQETLQLEPDYQNAVDGLAKIRILEERAKH